MNISEFNNQLEEAIQQNQRDRFFDQKYNTQKKIEKDFNNRIEQIVNDVWCKVDKFFDYNETKENGVSDDMGQDLLNQFCDSYFNDEDEDYDQEGDENVGDQLDQNKEEIKFIENNFSLIASKLQQKFEDNFDDDEREDDE